ncbi:MAG: argininosuccinate synthase, partial [Cytophagales bacterium]|nr:argininosuccinate synthase [Cytophagales bacterium]
MKKKVVLAFSGGLDTTYCVKYLAEDRGFEVHTVIVDTGGFSKEELADIERKAYELGVTSHRCVDSVNTYYRDCIKYL